MDHCLKLLSLEDQSFLFLYLHFGYPFKLMTDDKAIMSLFDPSRNVSPQASQW